MGSHHHHRCQCSKGWRKVKIAACLFVFILPFLYLQIRVASEFSKVRSAEENEFRDSDNRHRRRHHWPNKTPDLDSSSSPSTKQIDNARLSPASSFLDQEATFHAEAYNRIRDLVTETTIISWGIKKKFPIDFENDPCGSKEEFRIKLLKLSILRLHGKSMEEKQRLFWNLSVHNKTNYVWDSCIGNAVRGFHQCTTKPDHILFVRCNENAGEFSRYVSPNKTVDWDRQIDWTINNSNNANQVKVSNEAVFAYLNHPSTRAVITTQHHFLDHPKVHSLPIGIKYTMKSQILKLIQEPAIPKTNLLMINDNGWKHRREVTETIQSTFTQFGYVVKNTYNKKNPRSYLQELQNSKFVLAPSGLGWDCYRIWEAIHLRTIPIIERYYRPNDGWRRTLEDLPVLWVEDLAINVTPALLESEYIRIISKGVESYKYETLTLDWWENLISSKIE